MLHSSLWKEKRSLNTPGSVLWAGTMTVPPFETKTWATSSPRNRGFREEKASGNSLRNRLPTRGMVQGFSDLSSMENDLAPGQFLHNGRRVSCEVLDLSCKNCEYRNW